MAKRNRLLEINGKRRWTKSDPVYKQLREVMRMTSVKGSLSADLAYVQGRHGDLELYVDSMHTELQLALNLTSQIQDELHIRRQESLARAGWRPPLDDTGPVV